MHITTRLLFKSTETLYSNILSNSDFFSSSTSDHRPVPMFNQHFKVTQSSTSSECHENFALLIAPKSPFRRREPLFASIGTRPARESTKNANSERDGASSVPVRQLERPIMPLLVSTDVQGAR